MKGTETTRSGIHAGKVAPNKESPDMKGTETGIMFLERRFERKQTKRAPT